MLPLSSRTVRGADRDRRTRGERSGDRYIHRCVTTRCGGGGAQGAPCCDAVTACRDWRVERDGWTREVRGGWS